MALPKLQYLCNDARVLSENFLCYCRLLHKPLLSKLVDDCHQLLANSLLSNKMECQHAAEVTQQWLAAHCPDFINKDSWPPNSTDINPLDCRVWGSILEKFCHLNPQLKDVSELKSPLMKSWNDLSQDAICKSIANFRNRLQTCVNADGGHFEHLL